MVDHRAFVVVVVVVVVEESIVMIPEIHPHSLGTITPNETYVFFSPLVMLLPALID